MVDNPYNEYYPAPFQSDNYSYLWTADGSMAFDWQDELTLLPSHKTLIAMQLNGELDLIPGFKGKFILGPEEIENPDEPIDWADHADARHNTIWYQEGDEIHCVMRVRGWGHLTGCGAHHLPCEEAAKIQDGFLDWAVARLNEQNCPEVTEELPLVSLTFNRATARAEYQDIQYRKQQLAESPYGNLDTSRYSSDTSYVDDVLYDNASDDSSSTVWHDYWSIPTNHTITSTVRTRTSNQPWYARYQGKRKKKRR